MFKHPVTVSRGDRVWLLYPRKFHILDLIGSRNGILIHSGRGIPEYSTIPAFHRQTEKISPSQLDYRALPG